VLEPLIVDPSEALPSLHNEDVITYISATLKMKRHGRLNKTHLVFVE
jgi:hypothetical protein